MFSIIKALLQRYPQQSPQHMLDIIVRGLERYIKKKNEMTMGLMIDACRDFDSWLTPPGMDYMVLTSDVVRLDAP